MITTKMFSRALGNISEKYIDEAATYTAKEKNGVRWIKWGAMVACVALIFAVVANAPRLFDNNIPITNNPPVNAPPPVNNNPPVNDNTDVGDTQPPFVEESETESKDPNGELALEKYYHYEINSGAFAEYIGGHVVSEDEIGDKIENVVVTAGWKNESGEWLSIENLNAEVYEIRGVRRDVRVALKFIDKGEAVTTTHYYGITHPNAEYNGMILPDYKAENPVRYLEESDMGKCNGWQDFGLNGEIRTITVPVGSTYVYQMYSYYIRNDLTHLYSNWPLPSSIEELPEWLADAEAKGRKSFWYSMGYRLPANITVENVTEITSSEDGNMNFIAAEYKIQLRDGEFEKEESWIIYFMQEHGIYSAYAVVAHENFDFVKSYSESIVGSYQKKQ